jgi:hypothetical protein
VILLAIGLMTYVTLSAAGPYRLAMALRTKMYFRVT